MWSHGNVSRFRIFLELGEYEKARKLQYLLTPLAKAVTVKYGIGGLKVAMDLAGYFGGNPRLPLKRPGQEVEDELRRLLLKLKDLKEIK